MTEIISFAREWGPWLAILCFFSYKAIIFLFDKFAPSMIVERQAKLDKQTSEDNRLYELQAQTLKTLLTNTQAIEKLVREFDVHLGAMTRAIDALTLALARIMPAKE